MQRVNLFSVELKHDDDDPVGYEIGYARLSEPLGSAMLGGTLYELPTGRSICPYHYEYGNEEWVLVLAGRPTLRHPGGEDALAPGDVVCFPVGPEGAHKLTNPADETVRVLMLSTKHEPAVSVYPDSDKIGVWPGEKQDNLLVRRESNVDYWDRELPANTT